MVKRGERKRNAAEASKFTDAGEVRATAKAFGGYCNVSMTHMTPGIPAAEQTRIFEQFHRLEAVNGAVSVT
jgi:K+-sensing histidine kinase KdpD